MQKVRGEEGEKKIEREVWGEGYIEKRRERERELGLERERD